MMKMTLHDSSSSLSMGYFLSHYQRRALWDEHTATIETGVLQLQVCSCGTAF